MSQPSPRPGPVGVRPARPEDADAIATVQLAAWSAAASPDLAAAAAVGADERQAMAAQWRHSISEPPSPRHRVLVAVEGDPRAGTVVGLAATAPTADDDHDPAGTDDLIALSVDPGHARRGHGSRLLAAVADLLAEDGTTVVLAWVADTDLPLKHLLLDAGWAPDGARRELEQDDGSTVLEVRWHAGLGAPA